MVEIYQERSSGGRGVDGPANSAPVTPSRRGLGSSSTNGVLRRKKVLTPKHPNLRKGGTKQTDGKKRSFNKKSSTSSTVRSSSSMETATVRGNTTSMTSRKKSRIAKPRAGVSTSRVGVSAQDSDEPSAQATRSTSSTLTMAKASRPTLDGTRTSTSASISKLNSRAKTSLRTTSLGGKPARILHVPVVESKVEETSKVSAESKDMNTVVPLAEESSSLMAMAEEPSQPTTVATPACKQKPTSKSRNNGCNVDNQKTTTPPSTGSLREFIQQRRQDLKSKEKESSNDGDGTSIAMTKKKSVTFCENDDIDVKKASSSDQPHETSGGILMDLSNAFSREVSTMKIDAASVRTIGPTDECASAATKSLPVLCLGKFQESLWLDFGDESRNVVGKTRSLSFLLEAPGKSSGAGASGYWSVEFERIPFKKGFNLIVEEDDEAQDALSAGIASGDQSKTTNSRESNSSRGLFHSNVDDDSTAVERTSPTVLCIKNGDKKLLRLTWTPTEAGGVREAVHLKLPRGRIRITAHGKARAMKNHEKSKKKLVVAVTAENYAKGSIKSSSEPSPVTPHRLVRKAPRNKTVSSHASTPAPDFSNPRTVFSKSSPAGSITSASKVRCHIKYDSEWAEKQCDAYAKWLNYTIQPTEDVAHENSLHDGGDGDSCQASRSGLRTLLLHRRRAQARKRALELYHTDEMEKIRHSIEAEVDSGKLSIRSDRDVFADVGLRGQVMSLLMSYSTPWLRLGLETIFGEIMSSDISANSGSGEKFLRPRAMLKRFIVERIFSDPGLCKKYTGGRHATSNKTLSGRFDKEYKKAMHQHSLRCILLLVAFLDKAKMQNVLESVPCLFTRKAGVKSSKDVITVICRDLLFKEGNIFKHLSRLGLTVMYKQEPIDEFNYAVENLAVDLRDGVRLARMAEILTNDSSSSLIKQMRLPTISRLQKLHNTEVALSSLVDAGVPNLNDVTAHHIVDGHRPRVLKLLWSTIAHFKLPTLLDLDLLRQEIACVNRANRSRRVLSMRYIGNQEVERDEAETEGALSSSDGAGAEVGRLLLAWCQAVCSCFGLPVNNFTSSFADGKILCLLIHYYHPGMLKRSEVLPTTRDLPKEVVVTRSGERYEEALNNERKNSTLANKRVSELGGVPGMLPITDSCHVPEEKSTLLCLAYLCSRLMESSKDILATIAIQNCYRRYQNRVLFERKKVAAAIIIRYWQENKSSYFVSQRRRYGASVRVIEEFLCRNMDKIEVLRARRERNQARFISICRLQATVRRWIAVRKHQQMLVEFSSAKVLQAAYRGFNQRCKCATMESTSIVIQSTYRGYKAQRSFQASKSSAVIIQKSWRGFVAEFQFQCSLLNIVVVQSYIRRRAAIRTAEQRRAAVIQLQALARQKLAIHRIELLRTQFKAAATIQEMYRRRQARKSIDSMHSSAINIQASWRRFQGELQYMNVLMDTICIQCYARRLIARQQAKTRRSSIIRIQQTLRVWLSRRQLAVLRMDRAESQRIDAAVTVCQSLARRIVAVKRFEKMLVTTRAVNHAATMIQACYRGACSRQLMSAQHAIVTRIQSAWRRFSVELKFECTLMDIVYAQACARRFIAILEATKRTAAAVVLQCAVRKCIAARRVRARIVVNKEVDSFVTAVVVCQSVARRRMAVKCVNRKRSKVAMLNMSTVKIQTIWRGYAAEILYHCARQAIICMQSIVRRHQATRVATCKAVSVVTVQCMARQWLARRELASAKKMSEEEMAYHRLCACSSIEIQRMVRGLQARTACKMHVAARHIQKTWRGYVQHVDFMVSILSAIAIQTFARKTICRQRFQTTKLAVVALQGLARGAMVRALVQQELVAATRIQTWYRGVQAVDEYHNKQRAAIVIQGAVRGMIARRSIDLEHHAASEIQRVWRGYQANVDYIMIVLAAIQIQSVARMFSARKVLASWNEKKLSAEVERRHRNASARKIQRIYKKTTMERFLARKAVIIQRSIRAFIARSRAAKMMRLVTFVQSAFRARLVRRARTKKACVAARRIEKANEKAESEPQMRLGERTSAALKVLQTSKRLSEVIRSIKTLEVSTRLSEKCCRAFAAANAPEILYALIRTCNRSLPHVELLHFVLLTLKNVARYPHLLPSVATHDSLEVLLDLTQMFRDKENIFCLSIALLERIVLCDESLMDLCRSSENIKRLKGIHALCKRRQNMARNTPKGSVQYDLKRGIHTLEKILRRCKA